MNANAYTMDPVHGSGRKMSVKEFPTLQQHYNKCSNHRFSEELEHGCMFGRYHVNGLRTNKLENNFQQRSNFEWGKQRSDFNTDMGNQVSEASSFKCLYQEIPPGQNLMQQGIGGASLRHEASSADASSFSSIHRKTASLEVSSGFYNLSSSYPGLDYSLASHAGRSTPTVSNIKSSLCFQEPLYDTLELVSTLVASNSNDMLTPVDLKSFSVEVAPSPEQISSITACSDVECYSEKDHIDGGHAYSFSQLRGSESTSGNYSLQQHINQDESNLIKHRGFVENNLQVHRLNVPSNLDKYNAWVMEQTSQRTSEDVRGLSGMVFSKPEPLQQIHQQHYPTCVHYDESSNVQKNGCAVEFEVCSNQTAGKRPLKLPGLLIDPLHEVQRELWSGRTSKTTDSVLPLHNILFSYIMYKNIPANAERSRQDFVDYLHLTVCNDQRCGCDKYHILISHFDTCHYTCCSICGPVRKFCPVNKIYRGSGKAKRHLLVDLHPICSDSIGSCIIEDSLCSPKRLRTENGVASASEPKGAFAHSLEQSCATGFPRRFGIPVYMKEDAMEPNKELVSSMVDTTGTGVTRNCIADGNVECGSGSSRRIEGHLLEQPSEAPLHDSAKMKDVFRSTKNPRNRGNDAPENKMLENDYVTILPDKLIMVCKQREMDCASTRNVKGVVTPSRQSLNSESMPILSEKPNIGREGMPIHQEESIIDRRKEKELNEHIRLGAKYDSDESAVHHQLGIDLKDSKENGVSLIDFFTEKQIKEHLLSFNQFPKNIMKGLTDDEAVGPLGENTCQLCAVDRLMFTPSPIYCSSCGARIRRKSTYYWTEDETGAGHCFCALCFRESRGGNISFSGMSFSKKKLQKNKNEEVVEESWVQCDKCQHWQHQICALYNHRQDLEGKGKYICPFCRLIEIEAKEHVPIPAAFAAKDLPRTRLSDHIEERLFRSLKQERAERAKLTRKSQAELPEATGLVVRVVLAVDKQLKVKQRFLDILHGEDYPSEFPYRSKAILLFQKIEGVDVCIFGMYVQEFGSECRHPNQRCIYISYLDSVKYFRPEISTASGEALRTFVYHEILIGYLDYCKQQGFTSCYIWACPPLKGEDYILYCHPEGQKTPKTDKLCQWYKKMLRKAMEENIVVDYTNFYDHFFVRSGKCNTKITAACLPYFDGDYWSGAVEDVIQSIKKESGRPGRKVMRKRTSKAIGCSDLSTDAAKDILVMQKLGQSILPKKEDFIVVHLQFICIECHAVILSGSRWSCNQCNNFHLCHRCLESEQSSYELKTHTIVNGEKHQLFQIAVTDVAADTEDRDVILDNNLFGQRHAFLSFCQENHYQFDTLRRAKHSSMMILHHLNKMTKLTRGIACGICQKDIMVRWHCKICPEVDVCAACYQREGDSCHAHKLIQYLSDADGETNIYQRRKVLEKEELLNLLVHANLCQEAADNPCSYPNCHNVKTLFLHSRNCKLRLSGGCKQCKKIWFLLSLHSRNCRESNCRMPRCMELKKHREMRTTVSKFTEGLQLPEVSL